MIFVFREHPVVSFSPPTILDTVGSSLCTFMSGRSDNIRTEIVRLFNVLGAAKSRTVQLIITSALQST